MLTSAAEIGNSHEDVDLPPLLSLQKKENGRDLSRTIRIAEDFLPRQTLETMIERTNATGAEQGLVGGFTRHGKLIYSKIIEGSRATRDEETGKEIPARVSHSLFFPFGLRHPLLQFPSIFIHTHPSVKDFKTTIFSDGDITSYINNKYKAYFAVDNGGIHMLVGRGEDYDVNSIKPEEIIEKALATGEAAEKNRIMVARVSLADSLAQRGIRYYFTPSLQPQPDKTITFRDIRDVAPKLAA